MIKLFNFSNFEAKLLLSHGLRCVSGLYEEQLLHVEGTGVPRRVDLPWANVPLHLAESSQSRANFLLVFGPQNDF